MEQMCSKIINLTIFQSLVCHCSADVLFALFLLLPCSLVSSENNASWTRKPRRYLHDQRSMEKLEHKLKCASSWACHLLLPLVSNISQVKTSVDGSVTENFLALKQYFVSSISPKFLSQVATKATGQIQRGQIRHESSTLD